MLGDVVTVEADIFTDGHDVISAVALHRPDDQADWSEVRLQPLVNDRWRGDFPVEALGFHRFTFEAWIDHFLTWHRDLKKRVDGGAAEDELRRAVADRAGVHPRRGGARE